MIPKGPGHFKKAAGAYEGALHRTALGVNAVPASKGYESPAEGEHRARSEGPTMGPSALSSCAAWPERRASDRAGPDYPLPPVIVVMTALVPVNEPSDPVTVVAVPTTVWVVNTTVAMPLAPVVLVGAANDPFGSDFVQVTTLPDVLTGLP